MDIVDTIRKCDSWSPVEDQGGKDGRYTVEMRFDNEADAKAFAVEVMMICSDQEPYTQRIAPRKS